MSGFDAIRDLLPFVGAAGGLGGLALCFNVWQTNRRLAPKSKAEAEDITAAAKDKDWTRFQREIGRLVKRCETSDAKADASDAKAERAHARAEEAIAGMHACEQREVLLKGRVAELEAINRGRGQSAQEAATMLAAERIVERHAKDGPALLNQPGGDKPGTA